MHLRLKAGKIRDSNREVKMLKEYFHQNSPRNEINAQFYTLTNTNGKPETATECRNIKCQYIFI